METEDEFCHRYNLRKAKGTEAFDLTVSRGLGVAWHPRQVGGGY